MSKIFAILFIVALGTVVLFSGCCGLSLPGGQQNQTGANNETANQSLQTGEQVQNGGGTTGSGTGEQPVTDAGGEGSIIEVGGSSGGIVTTQGGTATSQSECATLTSTCSACVSKQGCGWCKSSNSCFLGDENGPKVSSCLEGEWAVTEAACAAPVGGDACSEKTNCADCLSGSGCKWCIQGSKCTASSDSSSCFGGWMTAIMQCNYASR